MTTITNKTDNMLNEAFIELLHIAVPSLAKTGSVIKATNLVNFGIILIGEDGTLYDADIDRNLANTIVGTYGSYYGIFNKHLHTTWEKIASAPLDTLIAEQLMHYFSTYGMEFLTGKAAPMLPAEKCLPEWARPEKTNKFTVIRLVSYETAKKLFIEKMTSVLKPAYAETNVIEKILEIYKERNEFPDINLKDIKSFEIMAKYCVLGNITPNDPQTFLRCVIYVATGTSMLIKNDTTIEWIKNRANQTGVTEMFKKADLVALSSIFLRYKPLFLAFKANKDVAPIINKIRRLAVDNHRPLPDVTVANAMNLVTQNRLTDVADLLNKMTLRNAVKLYNYGLNAMSDNEDVIYNIRNGKTYTTDRKTDKHCAETLRNMALTAIMSKLDGKFKGKTFYVPANVDYKIPVSEKQMLGNIPYGTTIFAEGDHEALCISIAWNNYNDTRTDIDLHLNSVNGSFGWNSNYRSDDLEDSNFGSCGIMYSGDMTDATNGATESFRVNVNSNALYLASVHLYSGEKECPYKVFLSAADDFRTKDKGMVEIDKALSAPIKLDFKQSIAQTIGYLYGNTFTFYGGCLTNNIVPNRNLYVKALNAIMNRCRNMMSLTDFIKYGGGKIVTQPSNDAIDFSPENVLSQSFFDLID